MSNIEISTKEARTLLGIFDKVRRIDLSMDEREVYDRLKTRVKGHITDETSFNVSGQRRVSHPR